MAGIAGWFSRWNRAVTVGTVFVLVVLLALVVAPIVTSVLAISTHAHVREVDDPLDDDLGRVADLVRSMESDFLRYVISGDDSYLKAYQEAARGLEEGLRSTRARAERLGPEAVRRLDGMEQSIRLWQQVAESVIALRQEGLAEESRARVAAGDTAQVIDEFWRRETTLHDYIVAVRDADRDRIDQILRSGAALGVALGALGVLAIVTVARLAQHRARLYEEVRVERGRAAELADKERRRADELDAVIENMSEGVTVADSMGRIVRFNRAARQIWQVSWSEGRYGHVSELMRLDLRYPDGRPIPPEELPIDRALRGETFSGLESVYTAPDGKRYHLRFGGSAVRDRAGRVVLAVTVYHDVTSIRELERQREEFISVIAHDLRGPITVIAGYAELLARLPPEGHNTERERKAINTISASLQRLNRMVADLLDASRIEAKRLSLAKEKVDLPQFVREVVERGAKLTEGHPVRVEMRGIVPLAQADPARLEQILLNLLTNAAKYSYPETEILVEIEPVLREVMISVMNQGPGISEEDRAELFTRFHRTRAAVEEKVPGLGLGLYITKGLVEAHGGRIWVESEVGRYATFRFTLPVG